MPSIIHSTVLHTPSNLIHDYYLRKAIFAILIMQPNPFSDAAAAASDEVVEGSNTVYGVERADYNHSREPAAAGDAEEDGGFSQWANDAGNAERQRRRQQVRH